jgi:hypothetical protein
MFSSIAGFMWSSAVVMYSVFTIIFLLLIRVWSRSGSYKSTVESTKSNKNITKSLTKKLGKKIKDVSSDTLDSMKSGLDVVDSNDIQSGTNSTTHLDTQFFGELFIAGLCAGGIVKYGW